MATSKLQEPIDTLVGALLRYGRGLEEHGNLPEFIEAVALVAHALEELHVESGLDDETKEVLVNAFYGFGGLEASLCSSFG